MTRENVISLQDYRESGVMIADWDGPSCFFCERQFQRGERYVGTDDGAVCTGVISGLADRQCYFDEKEAVGSLLNSRD